MAARSAPRFRRVKGVLVLASVVSLCACAPATSAPGPAAAVSLRPASSTAQFQTSPAPSGWVSDEAHVLSADAQARMTAMLAALEQRTHHQVVLVTTPDLGGKPIADYAGDLGNARGIGRKDVNDGVVIVIAPNERQVRIAVGDGLTSALPDALCQTIIEEAMLPRFRANDYEGGIAAGIDALAAHL